MNTSDRHLNDSRGWKHARLRWISKRYAGGTPNRANPDFWTDGNIPWLNSGSVNQGTITTPSTYITDEGFPKSSAKWIPKGALVMALAGQGRTKGTVGHLAIDSTCNQSLAAIVPTGVDGRFLYWFLASKYFDIRNLSSMDGRDGLTLDMIGSITCPIPRVETQHRIAQFLDQKTARIDTLIEKKRTLLDRLAEQRQALVTRAVTKGLDPDAPMKDSGIEWLGEIPAHWEIKPLRRMIELQRGHDLPAHERIEGKVPLVSSAGVSGRHDTAIAEPPGIVTGRYGTIGEFHFVDEPYWPLNTTLYSRRIHCDARYGWLMLKAMAHLFVLNSLKSAVPGVDRNDILSEKAPSPPMVEQKSVAEKAIESLKQTGNVENSISHSISMLTEYRTALITAAVAGQIPELV